MTSDRPDGMIQVYTGDGKGKTTAAIGQGVRAVGTGKTVYMVQFLKGGPTGEIAALSALSPKFQVFRFGEERDFVWQLSDDEVSALRSETRDAFLFAVSVIKDESADMLVLDEIMAAIENGFLDVEEVVAAIKNKPLQMEIVLTGRNAPRSIIDIADYVSNIICIKHPFKKKKSAREGIEY